VGVFHRICAGQKVPPGRIRTCDLQLTRALPTPQPRPAAVGQASGAGVWGARRASGRRGFAPIVAPIWSNVDGHSRRGSTNMSPRARSVAYRLGMRPYVHDQVETGVIGRVLDHE
jgi:hypothetical protein